jgi:hypothetical protein
MIFPSLGFLASDHRLLTLSMALAAGNWRRRCLIGFSATAPGSLAFAVERR